VLFRSDKGLQEAKHEMDQLWSAIESEADRISSDLGMELGKKLKFEKSPIYGYHMRLTRIDSTKIRGMNFIELATQKAGVLFTSSAMKSKSLAHKDVCVKYEKLQKDLVKEIISITASYFSVLELMNETIAHLDLMVSFAHVSCHAPIPYTRPSFSTDADSSSLDLTAARHPCLEMQDDVSFIPNDSKMTKGASSFQIITGPNMGGKSTYIRTMGIIALMSQIGSFVPCEVAVLPFTPFDAILCRVGAGDSQLKGVSTFMAEMLETAALLGSASEDSLIIIDELGRGTSTHDGFGLAYSIAEHIATNLECLTLFATHFHELTVLEEKVECVVNRHVQVDATQDEILLLYKVVDGICDESFGIHVAELAKFPDTVVKLAKRKADELESGGKLTGYGNWKSSRTDFEQGQVIIKKVFEEFASIDATELDDAQFIERFKEMAEKNQADIHGNPFISELLVTLG